MERIAQETEEDYQKLIKLLESFGVEILRPTVSDNYRDYLINGKIASPPMTPRDYNAMIGNTFYMNKSHLDTAQRWKEMRGSSWPENPPFTIDEINLLPEFIKQELKSFNFEFDLGHDNSWKHVIQHITDTNTIKYGTDINSATTTRIGKDLYFGTDNYTDDVAALKQKYTNMFPNYRCHVINTGGHADGTYCPVKPGLIISLHDVPTYRDTFPDWEVVYLPGQSWGAIPEFLNLKNKNKGKWWVPGEELNDEFTDFVESWLDHWVGYVEETVFDVNILVIDKTNVVCNNYNKQVFDAFERHGVTPHIVNFRHRYFWDGGLHCITSDVHRAGVQQDYFPERS